MPVLTRSKIISLSSQSTPVTNMSADKTNIVSVNNETKLECAKCGKISSVGAMARHLRPCYEDTMSEHKLKIRTHNIRYQRTDKFKIGRKLRQYKGKIDRRAKTKLGMKPPVVHRFFDVQKGHPLYWDKNKLPVRNFPKEYRFRLSEALRLYTRILSEQPPSATTIFGRIDQTEFRKLSLSLHSDSQQVRRNHVCIAAADYFYKNIT